MRPLILLAAFVAAFVTPTRAVAADAPSDHIVIHAAGTVPGAPDGTGWIEYLPPGYAPDGTTPVLIDFCCHDGTAELLTDVANNDYENPIAFIHRNDWPLDRKLAVLCPGHVIEAGGVPYWQMFHDFIAFAIPYYHLDPHCVTLIGHSWAGGAVWNYYTHFAGNPLENQVSATISTGAGANYAWPAQGMNLADVNFWLVSGAADPSLGGNPAMARQTVEHVLAMPSPPRLGDTRRTAVPGLGHNLFELAGNRTGHDIYTWMMSKRRLLPGESIPAAGMIMFTDPMAHGIEGDAGTTTHLFHVARVHGSSGAVSVHYATRDGQAGAVGHDYVPTSGTLTWGDGDSSERTIALTINGDTETEGDETVNLILDTPTGGAMLGTSTAEYTIVNDDNPAGIIALLDGDRTVAEGDAGTQTHTFRVGRRRGSEGAVSVVYRFSSGYRDIPWLDQDWQDWEAGVLTWADGDSSERTITAHVYGDTQPEPDEAMVLELSEPTGGASLDGDACWAELTVVNDDGVKPIQFVVPMPDDSRTPAGHRASFQVCVWQRPDATYQWQTAPAGSSDFTAIPGATESNYTTAPVTADMDGRQYRCIVSNAMGPATSRAAVLTVIDGGTGGGTPGSLGLTSTSWSAVEGNSGTTLATISVARTGGSTGAVSVHYATADGTATAGSDYTATSGTLSWADGDTGEKSFTVAITGDTVVEPDETVLVTLSGTTGGATLGVESATLTIVNDDTASGGSSGSIGFSSATYAHAEGDSGTTTATITVTRVGGTAGAVTVHYATADGTATAGSDYTATSGTLSWADGDASAKTFTVAITGDTTVEPDETIALALSAATGGATLGTANATLTIVNDDTASPGAIAFSTATYAQAEGNSGTTTATITVTRSGGAAGAVSVHYQTADGTATAGSDYTAASGTLNWEDEDGTAKTFTVAIAGDTTVEANETVLLTLSASTGGATLGVASATLSITDDDATAAGVIAFSSATYAHAEGNSGTTTATITVNRSGGSTGAVTAHYQSANGTATAGSDYTAVAGTLSWADGDAASKTFTVAIAGDTTAEADETVLLTLSAPTGGATLGGANATLTITNDDGAANLSPIVNAGLDQTVTLPATVTLSGTASDSDGSIAAYAWNQVSGPSSASIAAPSSATTSAGSLVAGVYVFRLTATDNLGATASDTVQVTAVVRTEGPGPVTLGPAPVHQHHGCGMGGGLGVIAVAVALQGRRQRSASAEASRER